MRRRTMLSSIGAGVCGLLAGCDGRRRGQPQRREIRLRVDRLAPTESGWELELRTNVVPVTGAIEDVTLVAYADGGTSVCERAVDQLDGGVTEYELECTGFPAIISAETATDCDEVETLYWVGTDEQRQQSIPTEITEDAILWETTTRECGESVQLTRSGSPGATERQS